jgi:alkylated DNA nucleotide flippase Atl1
MTENVYRAAQTIPPGTLTGFRGLAKRAGSAKSDDQLQSEYVDYLEYGYRVEKSLVVSAPGE